MLSEEAINTIKKAIKFKYDEHVSHLLSIPRRHLDTIAPNKGLPIINILEGLNSDTASEITRYGESLKLEVARVLKAIEVFNFSEEDKEVILRIIDDLCLPDIYKKRFTIMLESLELKVKSYGMAFDIQDFRVDIPRSYCDTGAENATRRIKAIIANDLSCLVLKSQGKPVVVPDKEAKQGIEHRSKLSVVKKIWADPVLSKVIATIILGIGALCWAWLHNIPKTGNAATPRVPPIVVEITNSSKSKVDVAVRGDFYLWLPGPSAQHTFGKYEFRTLEDKPLNAEVFTIDPTAKTRMLAHIMNQEFYSNMLKRADCDIALMVRKANGGHQTTADLPFTKEAIKKYYTTVDIGTK
jgi:hypothetical protein